MKTKEELEQIKNEYTELNKKLAELTEEELVQVTGGVLPDGGKIVFNGSHDYKKSELTIPIE